MPDEGDENLREEHRYWTSLEGNAGHFGADICALTVWYKGDQPVKWRMTEERWDLVGTGVIFSNGSREGVGAPPAKIDELPPPALPKIKGDEVPFILIPIDKNGYEAARKWAMKQTIKADPPYDPVNNNCGAFAMAFYKKTVAKEVPPPELDKPGEIIPGNILSWIKKLKERRICQHVWERRFVFRLNERGQWASNRPFYYSCKKCGMTKPQ